MGEGKDWEESAEDVSELGVLLREWVIPEQHQAGQHGRREDPARHQQLAQALRHHAAQLSVLTTDVA